MKRPNILFLLTDQQRPDSLGCYGAKNAKTPMIDELANEGVVFDNCYVQNPLCCPSRYSMLSGLYPHEHGVISNWYAPKLWVQSFGHAIKRNGYNTSLIGKMHFTPWQDCFGFDGRIIAEAKFHKECPDDYEMFLQRHGTSRTKLYDLDTCEYIKNCTAVKSKVPKELHIDSYVGMSVIEYLKNVETPFCTFASFLSPHNPYDPPEGYDNLFNEVNLPKKKMAENEIDNKPREAYDYINNRLKWPFKTDQLTDEQVARIKRAYYGTNTLIDDWVGLIIKTLKTRGLYDDTIIIYSSDHGDLLGDHGLIYKQCFYEQSVRAPLIIHNPKLFKPRRSKAFVESLDLYGTIIEMCGAHPTQETHSKSLLGLLKGERSDHRPMAFSENYFGTMVRFDDYKMVFYTGKPYGEFYNLKEDPDEFINLWDDNSYKKVKSELKDMLLEWSLSTSVTGLTPVRGDHFDNTPIDYKTVAGRAMACENQSWRLPQMYDFYQNITIS